MSDAPRPTREGREGDTQPLPTVAEGPIMHEVVAVELADMLKERLRIGIERYGQPLRAFNGRDPHQDAVEEAVDLLVYMRQARFESETMKMALKAALPYVKAREARCTSYDGVYDGQGPCWTCQGQEDHCPQSDLIKFIESLK